MRRRSTGSPGAGYCSGPLHQSRRLSRPARTRDMERIEQLIANHPVDKTKPNWRTSLGKPEVLAFEPGSSYAVQMETSKGTIVIRLLPEVAPMHVTSFLYLTQLGYFDGLAFHRVIQ